MPVYVCVTWQSYIMCSSRFFLPPASIRACDRYEHYYTARCCWPFVPCSKIRKHFSAAAAASSSAVLKTGIIKLGVGFVA